MTVTDEVWSSFLPDLPIPPALIRQVGNFSAGLTALYTQGVLKKVYNKRVRRDCPCQINRGGKMDIPF